MKAIDTRQFMALMAIAQHHGRPGTPTDQAHVESFFSHLKGDWPHLTEHHRPRRARHRARAHPRSVQHGPVARRDRLRHPRRRASRPRPSDPPRPHRRAQARARTADQAESKEEPMTPTRSSAGSAPRTLRKPQAKLRAAVKSSPTGPRAARREAVPLDGRAQRSYPNQPPPHSPDNWVRKRGCSIKGSDTPHCGRVRTAGSVNGAGVRGLARSAFGG